MHRLDNIRRTCEHPGRGPIHGRAGLVQAHRESATEPREPATSGDVARAPVALGPAAVAHPALAAPASQAGRTW